MQPSVLKERSTPEGVDIKGYLDPSVLSGDSRLLTTGQTSGCVSGHTYKYLIPFSEPISRDR